MLRQRFVRVEIGRRGVFVDADLSTAIGTHIYRHGWCDATADALRLLVGPGDTVIDGGANIGAFALSAASVVGPEGLVKAVEAAPGTAALLRRNVAANPGFNLELHTVALADEEGELDFTTLEPGSGAASIAVDGHGHRVRVPASTLDALTASLSRVDLLKLDLEGAELRALVGATRTLSTHRPYVIIEFEPAHLTRQGDSAEALEAFMTDRGYRASTIAVDGGDVSLGEMAAPWTRPAGEPNLVLVPEERALPSA